MTVTLPFKREYTKNENMNNLYTTLSYNLYEFI